MVGGWTGGGMWCGTMTSTSVLRFPLVSGVAVPDVRLDAKHNHGAARAVNQKMVALRQRDFAAPLELASGAHVGEPTRFRRYHRHIVWYEGF